MAECGERPSRARREGARAGPAAARPRHAAGGLPARARPTRLPVRGADARSAAWRARSRTRSPATRCCSGRSPTGSASRSPSVGCERVMEEIELPLVAVLRDMELLGVRLNVERLGEITERVRAELTELEAEIFELAGTEFLIASPQQLGEMLFEKLGPVAQAPRQDRLLDRRPRAAGDPLRASDRAQGRALSRALDAGQDLPRRAARKWSTSNSRIHTTFLQAVAQTGRLSSTNPNMQNVPIRTPLGREIRGCFEAQRGPAADQRRLLADRAAGARPRRRGGRADGDLRARRGRPHGDRLARVRRAAGGIDPGMRSKAKMINYGIVYGLSDFGLADRLNIPREEAKEFIDAYLERFPALARFMVETVEQASERGDVQTLWGRRRQIPELRARNYQVRTQGERLAVNTVIQGTAADIIKLAMVRTHRALADAGLQHPPAADDPRRAAVRRPARGGAGRARADRARDVRRVGAARAAAGGRHRRGRHLAGGEVRPVRRVSRRWPCSSACWRRLPRRACRRRSTRAWARSIGTLPAASFSFLVGTAALVVITSIVHGGLGALGGVGRAPWWALVGGLLGAVYVTVALVAVRTLGAAGLTAVVIVGQLAISVVIDRFGLLGVAATPSARSACSAWCCSWPASCWSCASSARRRATERRRGNPPARPGSAGFQPSSARARGVARALRAGHHGDAVAARGQPRERAPARGAAAGRRAPRERRQPLATRGAGSSSTTL